MRATVVLGVLLFSTGTAHAQIFAPPPAMVAYRDSQHGPWNAELTALGSSLVAWDGESFEGTAGGGLGAAVALRGWWPDWRETSEWAVAARVRVLATHVPAGGPDIEVPIDVLVRWGALTLRSHLDTTGWPTEVFEPEPWIPYLALGLTLDVSTQHGLVRPGPVLLGGIHWWIAPRFGIVSEIEVRAIFGDVRPVGQLGGSLGIVIGL